MTCVPLVPLFLVLVVLESNASELDVTCDKSTHCPLSPSKREDDVMGVQELMRSIDLMAKGELQSEEKAKVKAKLNAMYEAIKDWDFDESSCSAFTVPQRPRISV